MQHCTFVFSVLNEMSQSSAASDNDATSNSDSVNLLVRYVRMYVIVRLVIATHMIVSL